MRVTVANAFESSIANLQRRQQDLSESQKRLTSGKRVEVASDDPVGAARAERALASMVRSEANQRALETSRNVMQQAEAALGDSVELMQQAREMVVNAGDASYDDKNRKTLANALDGLRKQLLSVANRTDGAGGYLFAGQGADSPPFDYKEPANPPPIGTPREVVYRGTGGQSNAPSDEPLPLSVDGEQTWLSIFSALKTAIVNLNTENRSGEKINADATTDLKSIDTALNNLLTQRAAAGETLNRTDSVETRISATKLAAQTERSNAEDLDMVQAISEFQNKQSGYDAALKSYSLVQKLSLFQYLSA
jgi:flagellar hook-associated protein 3 FlgL